MTLHTVAVILSVGDYVQWWSHQVMTLHTVAVTLSVGDYDTAYSGSHTVSRRL